MKRKPSNEKKVKQSLPMFCDFNCRYAEFAENDSVGACRREQAVFCMFIKKYNKKHAKCLVKK
ncbi:MAG: hypothetical protein HYZ34_08550 [Ignavibacteriae bacterium]|nr:hypothetical protein [Ignavibacteriota bacterium]